MTVESKIGLDFLKIQWIKGLLQNINGFKKTTVVMDIAAVKIFVPDIISRAKTPRATLVGGDPHMVQIGTSLWTVSFEKAKSNKAGLRNPAFRVLVGKASGLEVLQLLTIDLPDTIKGNVSRNQGEQKNILQFSLLSQALRHDGHVQSTH